MIVGVAHTKKTNEDRYRALCDGVKACGDKLICIDDFTQRNLLGKCEVFIQIGSYNKNLQLSDKSRLRKQIWAHCQKQNKNVAILDCAFVLPENGEHYYSFGFNGLKRNAYYRNTNCPRDRWDKLGIKLEDWREPKSDQSILVCGQTLNGSSTQNVNIAKWHNYIIQKILDETSRNIIFRVHRNYSRGNNYELLKKKLLDSGRVELSIHDEANPLKNDLDRAFLTVVYNTNACVESVIKGIPVYASNMGAMSWEVSNQSKDIITDLATPERQQWANNIAYCQWTLEELRNGKAWKHLRKSVTDDKISIRNFV